MSERRGYQRPERFSAGAPEEGTSVEAKSGSAAFKAQYMSIFSDVQQNLPSLDGFDSDTGGETSTEEEDHEMDERMGEEGEAEDNTPIKIFQRADGKSSMDKDFILNSMDPSATSNSKEELKLTQRGKKMATEGDYKLHLSKNKTAEQAVLATKEVELKGKEPNTSGPQESIMLPPERIEDDIEQYENFFKISDASQPFAKYFPMSAPTILFQFEDTAIDELLNSLESEDFVDEWDLLVQEHVVTEEKSLTSVKETLDLYIKERKEAKKISIEGKTLASGENVTSNKETQAKKYTKFGERKYNRSIFEEENVTVAGCGELKGKNSSSGSIFLDLRQTNTVSEEKIEITTPSVSAAAARMMSARMKVDKNGDASQSSSDDEGEIDPIAWKRQRKLNFESLKRDGVNRVDKKPKEVWVEKKRELKSPDKLTISENESKGANNSFDKAKETSVQIAIEHSECQVLETEDAQSVTEVIAEISDKEKSRRIKLFKSKLSELVNESSFNAGRYVFHHMSSFDESPRILPVAYDEFLHGVKPISLLSLNTTVHPVAITAAVLEWLLNSLTLSNKETPFKVLSIYYDVKENCRYLRVIIEECGFRNLPVVTGDWSVRVQLFLEKTSLGVLGEDFATSRSYRSSSKMSSVLSSSLISREEMKDFLHSYNECPSLLSKTLDASQCELSNLNGITWSEQTDMGVVVIKDHAFARSYAVRTAFKQIVSTGLEIIGLKLVYLKDKNASSNWAFYTHELGTHQQYSAETKALLLAVKGKNVVDVLSKLLGPSDPKLAKETDPHSLRAQFGETKATNCFGGTRSSQSASRDMAFWFGSKFRLQKEMFSPKVSDDSIKESAKKLYERALAALVSPLSSSPVEYCYLVSSPLIPPSLIGLIMQTCQDRGFNICGIKRMKLDKAKVDEFRLPNSFVYSQSAMLGSGTFAKPQRTDHHNPKGSSLSPNLILMLQGYGASFHVNTLVDKLHNMLHGLKNSKHWYAGIPRTDFGLYATTDSFQFSSRNNADSTSPYFSKIATCPHTQKVLGDIYSVPDRYGVEARVNGLQLEFHSFPEMEQTLLLAFRKPASYDAGSILRVLTEREGNCKDDVCELLAIKWIPQILPYQAKELTTFEVGDEEWQKDVDALCCGSLLLCVLRKRNGFESISNTLQALSIKPSVALMSLSPEMAFRQISIFFREKELIFDPHFANEKALYYPPQNRCKGILTSLFQSPELLQTIAVIKPGMMQLWPKILKTLAREGFEIVGLKLLKLRGKQARALVAGIQSNGTQSSVKDNLEVEFDFEKAEQYLQSGPVLVLCLQRYNAIKHLLDTAGPEDPAKAISEDTFYLRSYGKDIIHNCIHCSRSYTNALREKDLFFAEGLCGVKKDVRGTLRSAIDNSVGELAAQSRSLTRNPISPKDDAVMASLRELVPLVFLPNLVNRDEVSTEVRGAEGNYIYLLEKFVKNGFKIVNIKLVHFTQKQARELCEEREDELTRGCCIVAVVERENAGIRVEQLFGRKEDKNSISAMYGNDILYPGSKETFHADPRFFFSYLCDSSFSISAS